MKSDPHETITPWPDEIYLPMHIWKPKQLDVDLIHSELFDQTKCQLWDHSTGYSFVVTQNHRRFCIFRRFFGVN